MKQGGSEVVLTLALLSAGLAISSTVPCNGSNVVYTDRYVRGGVHGLQPSAGCRQYTVTLEMCRELLAEFYACNTMIYSRNSWCTLYNRHHKDFKRLFVEEVKASSEISIISEKHWQQDTVCSDHSSDESSAKHANSTRRFSALSKYSRCLKSGSAPHIDELSSSSLPRLHIVIFFTRQFWEQRGSKLKEIAYHWECYAKSHNYTFSLHIFNSNVTMPELFVQRHEELRINYLPHAQFVLHVDGDTAVLNFSRSIDYYLDLDMSVLLQFRENHEVSAAVYIVKNDIKGHCFLKYWRHHHAKELSVYGPNFDNGALLAAILLLIMPTQTVQCIKSLYEMPTELMKLQLMSTKYAEHYCMSQLQKELYLSTSMLLEEYGIYIIWPHEGFWRSHEALLYGEARSDPKLAWYRDKFNSCYPSSDVLGHGDKSLLSQLSGNISWEKCQISFASSGEVLVPTCNWLTEQREMDMNKRYCFMDSILCIKAISRKDFEFIKDRFKPHASRPTESFNITHFSAFNIIHDSVFVNACMKKMTATRCPFVDMDEYRTEFWYRFGLKLNRTGYLPTEEHLFSTLGVQQKRTSEAASVTQ